MEEKVRVWPGQYIPVDHEDPSSHAGCKIMYLQWIERLFPYVLEELRNDVPPLIEKAKNEMSVLFDTEEKCLVGWELLEELFIEVADTFPDLMELRNGLVTWARKYNLTDPWIIDCALNTLWLLDNPPQVNMKPDILSWCYPNAWSGTAFDFDYIYSLDNKDMIKIELRYNPAAQDRKTVKEKINKLVKERLDDIEKDYKECQAFEKGLPSNNFNPRNIKWLAMCKVGKMGHMDIVRSEWEEYFKKKYSKLKEKKATGKGEKINILDAMYHTYRKTVDEGIIRAADLAGVKI